MKLAVFKVDELECTSCANTIEKQLAKKGITDVSTDVIDRTISITYDESKYTINQIADIIKSAGFTAEFVND